MAVAKCNGCGREKVIVLSSLLDGKLCTSCVQQMFTRQGGTLVPLKYNRALLNNIIQNLSPPIRGRLAKALKDIYSRYTASIRHFEVFNRNVLKIYFDAEYRNKEARVTLTAYADDNNRPIEYYISGMKDGQPYIVTARNIW